MLRGLFIVTAIVALAAGPGPAPARAAAATPAVSPAVKLRVVRLAREGKRAFARKDYAEALKKWREAYGLWPRPLLLFNIALACERLDRPAESLTFLREFRKESAGQALPRALERSVAKLEGELALRTAILAVTGPKGARVTLDGKLLGLAPLEVVVRPGRRALEVSLPDRPAARREIDLPAGKATRLAVEVPPARPVTPPRPRPAPPAGPRWQRLHFVYCAAAGGLALALAGAAVGTGLRAVSAYDAFQDAPTRASRDRVVAWRDATNSLWALAGVAGASAALLAVFTRWRRRPEAEAEAGAEAGPGAGAQVGPGARPGVSPTVTVDLAGLGLRVSGTF